MKIVHVFNSSIVSGPETLVLPALPELGHPVSVIFLTESRRKSESQGPIEYAKRLGLDVHIVKVRGRIDALAVLALKRLLNRLDPAIVHAHDVKASTYVALAGGSRVLFSTHHGVRGRSGWKPKFYEGFYTRIVLRRFDRVLSVCTTDRALLIARGLNGKKVSVHLNGVDRPKITAAERGKVAARLRVEWGLSTLGVSESTTLLGVVGRLAPEKRIDRILRTVARLAPASDWALVVFGRGPEEARLKIIAAELGLGKRVHWMGYRNDVGSELAGLDILLSFSDAEGLPINLVEAGWALTPVMATAVDGNLDLIPTADEGILFPVRDNESAIAERLARLIADKTAQRQIGERFQDRVERQFSGKCWLKTLRAFYAEAAPSVVS